MPRSLPSHIAIMLLAIACAAQEPIVQTSNTTENLRGLSVPSNTIAWASGTHGTYLRTVDAGKSWTAAQVPGADALDFRDVQAFSADLAYLLAAGPGEQSRIYKTEDGGLRWTLQLTNHDPKGFLDCMAFWDKDHGITLGDPVDGKFMLLATSDGGKHWKRLLNPPAAIEGEGAFAASGTCIAVAGKHDVWFSSGGAAARVFHSANRGKTWSVAETPLPHANATSGIFSIAFSDSTHGVVAGGDYKLPDEGSTNLAFSDDGGKTWKVSPIAPQAYFSAVALSPNSKSVVAVGTAHAGFGNNPQGKDWKASWPLSLNAVAFDPEGDAFAVGPKGFVVKFPLSR